MTSAVLNNRTQFVYDGEGQRVVKLDCPNVSPCTSATTGAIQTVYVYDASGNLAAEYSNSAANAPCTTCYVTVDQLGSTRVLADPSGNVVRRYDYMPFGEEIPADGSARTTANGYQSGWDGFTLKFAGQLRDSETGFDFFNARYYSPAQGRFLSPDPENFGARSADPQSWNGYSYVLNNPLANIDPSGLSTIYFAGGVSGSSVSSNWQFAFPSGSLPGLFANPAAVVGSLASGGDVRLKPGPLTSTDNRYVLFVSPSGGAHLDRTGADATIGPEFDIVAGGAKLAGAGLFALLRPALRAASRRLGLEVGADLGIALSRSAVKEALADEGRVLHSGRNLVKGGVIQEGTNTAIAAGTRAVAEEILNHPIASFIDRIGLGTGETAVRVFVGRSGGQLVGVAIADEAAGAVAKGQIVTTLIIK